MLCPIKVNSNTIELTVHTSCYCVLDLLCVTSLSLKKMEALPFLVLRLGKKKANTTNAYTHPLLFTMFEGLASII